MENTKLILILKSLTKDEFRDFEKFAASPYFNRGRNYSKFLKGLKTFYPEFNQKRFKDLSFLAKVYGGKKYGTQTVYNMVSGLTKLAEEFLIQIAFEKQKFSRAKYLLEESRERKLNKIFLHNLELAEHLTDTSLGIDEEFFLRKLQLEELNSVHELHKMNIKEHLTALSRKSEYVINFFIINFLSNYLKIFYNSLYWSIGDLFNRLTDFKKFFNIDGLMLYLKNRKSKFYSVLEVYCQAAKAVEHPSDYSCYLEFKRLFKEQNSLFAPNTRFFLIVILDSVCYKNIIEGNAKYREERFRLNKEMLTDEVLAYENQKYIDINLFRNILMESLDLKQIKWASAFAKEYIERISPEFRESMTHLSSAWISFSKGEFADALENLIKINFEYFVFKLDYRRLMLKIYYELVYYEQADSLISAFKHFLSSSGSITELIKNRNERLIYFTQHLLKIKFNHSVKQTTIDDKAELKKIKTQLLSETAVTERDWLLEKVQELEMKFSPKTN